VDLTRIYSSVPLEFLPVVTARGICSNAHLRIASTSAIADRLCAASLPHVISDSFEFPVDKRTQSGDMRGSGMRCARSDTYRASESC